MSMNTNKIRKLLPIWHDLYLHSRARMGIQVPPFRWRYLLHWWGWRLYVLSQAMKRLRRAKRLVFKDAAPIVNSGPIEYTRRAKLADFEDAKGIHYPGAAPLYSPPRLCSHPNAEPVRNPGDYFTDYCDDCGSYGKRIGMLPVKWSEFDELQRDHMEWNVYAAKKAEKKQRRALLLE